MEKLGSEVVAEAPATDSPLRKMLLTPELVAKAFRKVEDPAIDPSISLITDTEIGQTAARLESEARGAPLWIFAYGSLIWKPDFDAEEQRVVTIRGWHRSFCLHMTSWRATPEVPGLMLALDRGGQCRGVAFRLADEDRVEQLKRLVRREIHRKEHLRYIRWVPAVVDQQSCRVLVFWAGPTGVGIRRKLSVEETAKVLASACGHVGSCAEYLFETVKHLEALGIHDRNLWQLQELVAKEILRNSDFAGSGAP